MRTSLARILGALLLCACANPLNEATYHRYYEAGLEAERNNQLELARENYRRALINAQMGYLGDHYEAAASYQLARMNGFLCDYDAADELFRASIEFEEKAAGAPGLLSRKLLEYARFLSDRGQPAEALQYFARGLEIVDQLGAEQHDPIGVAGVLDRYAAALLEAGESAEATQAQERAEALRAAHPARVAQFQPDSYAGACP